MKRALFILGLLFGGISLGFAFQTTVWLASNTATNISTSSLCGQQLDVGGSSVPLRGVLHGVCINTAATGNVQVFTSSWTASSGTLTGLFSTATQAPCNFYDAYSTNGLSYNKNGTADITILYNCY